MGDARRKELDVLKQALTRILQEENPLAPNEQQARDAELSRRLSSDGSHGSPAPAQALDAQDLSIMSRLLSQVHHLMEAESEGEELMPAEEVKKPDIHDHRVEIEKSMVQSVVDIASAAAEAAKAAAASSGKNVEVMETLLSNSEKNARLENGDTPEVSQDESSRQPAVDKEMVRRLIRQNRITHFILGVMVVATAIWRFKMVSLILKVRKRVSNPFQTLGDIVTDGFKGNSNEDSNGEEKGFQKAKPRFPLLLGGEQKEIAKTTKKSDNSTTEEFKLGEAITFSFDNLMAAGGFSDKQASENTREGPSEQGSSTE